DDRMTRAGRSETRRRDPRENPFSSGQLCGKVAFSYFAAHASAMARLSRSIFFAAPHVFFR
ncbi:MAG: hypothetical protein ACOC98_17050, partial [Thermodesulfobacteriota bacterium]